MEGSLLDQRYEIRTCLGKGGMGVVYEAYDRVLEERVAIKVLRGQDDKDEATARRFRSEIKLARRVTHRNVCRIHDYGEDGSIQYISMQFLEGIDLRARLRKDGRLPPQEAYEVALQIADGLQAVHDEGIVHRDLKTANVMIDGQGVARLMDFGIAKASSGGESLTATGVIVGTPEYMSPEQIRGGAVDARSDVYSMGVILFELFTGSVPFTSDSAVGTLMKHLQDEPPLDTAAASALAPPLRQVIRGALAKERDHRYKSARELADALRAARAASAAPGGRPAPIRLPTPAPPPATLTAGAVAPTVVASAGPAGARAGRVHRGVWALVLLALLAVPAALWIGWRMLGAGPTTDPSPVPRTNVVAPTTTPRTDLPSLAAPSPAAPTTIATPPPAAAPQISEAATAGELIGYCDRGVAEGCLRLGIRYNTGQGVEKDVARAAELYERACNLGSAGGCNNLGSLYEFGLIGIGPNRGRAAALYRQACDRGDAQACANLGRVSPR